MSDAQPNPVEPRRTGAAIRRWVIGSTSANLVSRGVAIIVTLVLTPYVLGRLGGQTYGLWVLAGAIVGYAALLDLGIAGALTKYVAEHRQRDEWDATNDLIATGLRIYSLMAAVVLVLAASAAVLVPAVFPIPPSERATATTIIGLLGAGVAVAIPAATTSAILKGIGRYDVVAVVRLVSTIASAAATIAVIELGFGVVGMAATSAPITILTFCLGALALRRVEPRVRLGLRAGNRSTAGAIASFSAPLVVLEIAGRLQSESDEIVIGAFLPLASITPFALAARLSGFASLITEQFAAVLLPLASSLDAAGDRRRLQEVFLTGTRITVGLFVPIGLALVVLADPFLTAWVGAAYASAGQIVLILVIAAGIDMAMWPAGFVLQGVGRHRRLAWLALGSGVGNLVLSVALIGPLGITGVALGTLVATTIECLAFVTPYTLGVLEIDPGRAFRQIVIPTVLPALVAAVMLLGVRFIVQPTSLLAIVLVALPGLAVYGAGYLAMGPAQQERRLVAELLRATRARVARA